MKNLYNNIYKDYNNIYKDINSVAKALICRYYSKNNKIINLASGITPAYELGDFYLREILINHEIMVLLKKEGVPSLIYLFVDDHDPLNERYLKYAISFFMKIDRSINISILTENKNKPLFKVPDPLGCHKNLSDHFLDLFLDKLEYIGLTTNINVIKMSQLYMNKKFRETILKKIASNYHLLRNILLKYDKNLLLRYLNSDQKYVDVTVEISSDELMEVITNKMKDRFFKVSAAIEFAYRWWWFDIHFEPFSQKYFSGHKALFYVTEEISRNVFTKNIITLNYGLLRFHLLKEKYGIMPSEILDLHSLKNLILKRLNKEHIIHPSEIEGYLRVKNKDIIKNYTTMLVIYELVSSIGTPTRKYTFFNELRKYIRLYEIARLKNMVPSQFGNLDNNIKYNKDEKLALLICNKNINFDKYLYKYFYKRVFNTSEGPKLSTFIEKLPYFAKLFKDILCSKIKQEER